MWPEDRIKKLPIFSNNAQIVAKSFLHESCIISNSPKINHNIWATFVRKLVTKRIKKSPKVVTLLKMYLSSQIKFNKWVIGGLLVRCNSEVVLYSHRIGHLRPTKAQAPSSMSCLQIDKGNSSLKPLSKPQKKTKMLHQNIYFFWYIFYKLCQS